MQKGILEHEITKFTQESTSRIMDSLAIEEPLEIRLIYGPLHTRITKSISVTMRTPGNDEELALGFLFTEGILQATTNVDSIKHKALFADQVDENIIEVHVNPAHIMDLSKLERNFYTTSSCGVCGKSSIESIKTVVHPSKTKAPFNLSSTYILSLPDKLRKAQAVFDRTGGLHASALFNLKGEIMLLREDVGRHNALDKLIGAGKHLENLDWRNHVLLLSGRASFELIQKAAMANIPVVVAVGAPSSLAVSLAQEFSITLIGFLKTDKFNLYTHPDVVAI